jgi:hypothetical protein
MPNYSNVHGSADVHILITCRVGAIMLATLIAGRVPSANAQSISLDTVTFKTTDDGLSIPGMFFAKLETLHAKHMSGEDWKGLSASSITVHMQNCHVQLNPLANRPSALRDRSGVDHCFH